MNRSDMLASLMVQAETQGAQMLTLRAIVEETVELSTGRVLERLGLGDDGAEDDLDELRELLSAWRDAKSSAWKALIGWAVRACLALLILGMAVRLGVWELL